MLLVRSMISCSIGFSPSIFIAANKSWNDLFINILVLPLACTIHYSLENGIGIKHIPILLRSTFLFYFPSIPNKSKVIWNKFQQTISGGYPEIFNPSFTNCAAPWSVVTIQTGYFDLICSGSGLIDGNNHGDAPVSPGGAGANQIISDVFVLYNCH